MTDKKTSRHTIHETDIRLNKNKLKEILDNKGMDYIDLYYKVTDTYGLDITYKGFMGLLSNRTSWKLLYAHAISEILNIDYMDIFEIVKVDVEKAIEEKERWKEKYQK